MYWGTFHILYNLFWLLFLGLLCSFDVNRVSRHQSPLILFYICCYFSPPPPPHVKMYLSHSWYDLSWYVTHLMESWYLALTISLFFISSFLRAKEKYMYSCFLVAQVPTQESDNEATKNIFRHQLCVPNYSAHIGVNYADEKTKFNSRN